MQLNLQPTIRKLRAAVIVFLAPIVIMMSLMHGIQPAMAMANHPFLTPSTFGAMSNKIDAAAKDAEGKAKQVQASAMNVAEDVKKGAREAGNKIADSTGKK